MSKINSDVEDSSSHAQLVRRAQAGDRAAMGELFERFNAMVIAIIVTRVPRLSDAEELSQDVFVKMLSSLSQLRDPEAFPGWLKRIAQRRALNFVRRRATLNDPDEAMAAALDHEVTPLVLAIQSERRRSVRSGFEELRLLDREALNAYYLEGKTVAEIAEEFAAPVGTIKRRLHVARKRLASEFRELAAV